MTDLANVDDPGTGKSASWGDYDNDGHLDLFVANWSCIPRCPHPYEGERDALYHNKGDGTFDDVRYLLNPGKQGAGFIASWTDYDNDGDLDLYVVNDEFVISTGNLLYRNEGAGCDGWCFSEISAESGSDTLVMGMGLAADDFDGNGLVDLYFSNAGEMKLLQQTESGAFVERAGDAGVSLDRTAVGWGALSLDYDNDGWRDLYQALMMHRTSVSPFNPLYHNNGDGTFTQVGHVAGADDPGPSVGVAYADYDRDGWVDLIVGNYRRGYELYHNQALETEHNHGLTFKLVGGGPVNRDAVGTKVWVSTRDGRTQMQEVRNGVGLGGGSALQLYFGLGKSEVESVEILWP